AAHRGEPRGLGSRLLRAGGAADLRLGLRAVGVREPDLSPPGSDVRRGAWVRGALLLGLAFAGCGLLALRTLGRGSAELAASDAAFESGQGELALRPAERAAAAYVPGGAHVSAAYARLRALAVGAEREGDRDFAARAWRAERAAALQSAHLWQP